MVLKITKIGDAQLNSNQPEGWFQWGARNLIRGGARAGEQVANLADTARVISTGDTGKLASHFGNPSAAPKPQDAGSQITQGVEQLLPEGYLQPKGNFEEWLDKVYSDVPTLIATQGSSIPLGLARSAVSNAAIQKVQKDGGGPIKQLLAGLVGGAVTDFAGKGLNLKGLKQKAETVRKDSYAQATPAAKQLNVDAQDLRKSVYDLGEELQDLQGTFPSKGSKTALQYVRNLQSDFNPNNTLNVKTAWDRKKQLNRLLREKKVPEGAIVEVKRMSKDLTDWLNKISPSYPEFGIPYQRGEDLTRGLRIEGTATKLLNKTAKSPWSKIALAVGSGIGSIATGNPATLVKILGGGIAAPKAAKKVSEFWDFVSNSKEVQGWMKDIALQSAQGDTASLANTLRKIDKSGKAYEKQQQSKGRFKIRKL